MSWSVNEESPQERALQTRVESWVLGISGT